VSNPITDPETAILLATLEAQREHVLGILDGLDDAALRRPVLPSGWSCLDLVNHLAVDVERFWFRAVAAAEPEVIDWFATAPDEGWKPDPKIPAAEILDLYRKETELASAIISATAPDAAPRWWPGEQFGDFRLNTLRELMLHAITETACHAGHLDAARELTDGRKWLVLTEFAEG
jgi:uncharacterized damage-inducible protein DinB